MNASIASVASSDPAAKPMEPMAITTTTTTTTTTIAPREFLMKRSGGVAEVAGSVGDLSKSLANSVTASEFHMSLGGLRGGASTGMSGDLGVSGGGVAASPNKHVVLSSVPSMRGAAAAEGGDGVVGGDDVVEGAGEDSYEQDMFSLASSMSSSLFDDE